MQFTSPPTVPLLALFYVKTSSTTLGDRLRPGHDHSSGAQAAPGNQAPRGHEGGDGLGGLREPQRALHQQVGGRRRHQGTHALLAMILIAGVAYARDSFF